MGTRANRRVFDRVLVIMFENQYRSYVLANPYMRRLARQGCQLGNAFGVMHPSQTNYIASIAGALCNVTSDDRPPVLDGRTVVDLIEEAPGRLDWKGYMESYVPAAARWSPEFVPQDAFPYLVKHNPFSSFASVVHDESRWARIDDDAGFFADVLAGELPEYAWFTPNMWSDGHWIDGTQEESTPRAPQLVDQLARWLERFFHRLRFPGADSLLPPRTLVVVTFDESDFEADYLVDQASPYDGPNQIYTVLLGDCVEPGFEEEGYNHYSLLRTIEQNFGLDHLGRNDAESNWFQFLWGRRYEWGETEPTPISNGSSLAAAQHAGGLFVAIADGGTVDVHVQRIGATAWGAPTRLAIDASASLALASTSDELVLAAIDADGTLATMRYDVQTGWSEASQIAGGPFAACALSDVAGLRRVVLAAADRDGAIVSRTLDAGGEWSEPLAVDACTAAGPIALGRLGASLMLLAVDREGAIQVVSQNTAEFNVVTVAPNPYGGPQDDTTIDRWSPSAFPVAHFSSRSDATGRRRPELAGYRTSGPLAVATLDGVLHLVHPGPANPTLLTETFSLSGLLTPGKPVSYKDYESSTSSNGFGTLAEAGWSHQLALFESACSAGGALAMARAGDEIVLLDRAGPCDPVLLRRGRYVGDASPPDDE